MSGSSRPETTFTAEPNRSGIERYCGAVAKQPACPRPHRQPRRQHEAHGGRHAEQLVIPADQPGNDLFGTFLGLPEAISSCGSILSGPMTLDSGSPPLWRSERPVAALVLSAVVLPSRSPGASWQASGWPRAARRALFSSGADRAPSSTIPSGSSSGGGRHGSRLAGQPGREPVHQLQNSSVPTLLIGGTLDFETPAQNTTKGLLPLSNGHQVILSGLGHVDDFDAYEPSASTQLLTTFYATGQVETSGYTPNVVSFATPQSQAALPRTSLGL